MTSEAALAKLSYVLGLPGLGLSRRKEVRDLAEGGASPGGVSLGLKEGRDGGHPLPIAGPMPRPGSGCDSPSCSQVSPPPHFPGWPQTQLSPDPWAVQRPLGPWDTLSWRTLG